MFSIFLRQKVDESGKTQKEIADYAEITTAALANYLNGKRCPQFDVAEKMLNICGYDVVFSKKDSTNVDVEAKRNVKKVPTNVSIGKTFEGLDINGAIDLANTPASRLATLVGVPAATLAAWQNGTAQPTTEQLVNLFNLVVALGLSSRTTTSDKTEQPPAQATG